MYSYSNILVNVINAAFIKIKKHSGFNSDAFTDLPVIFIEGVIFQVAKVKLQLRLKNQ